MTPQEAKKRYGAEFYMPMKDGVTPQMYYKYEDWKYNTGETVKMLVYLSFANIWMGSSGAGNKEFIAKLIPIE